MEKTSGAGSILNMAAQAGLANLPNIGKVAQTNGTVSFSETFMKTSEVKSFDGTTTGGTETKNAVKVTSSSVSNNNTRTAKEIAVKEDVKTLDEGKQESLAKEVEEVIEQIKDKIKDNFEVTDEEIEKAMEVLGLMMVDLTNGADLRTVIMELTGTKDSIELLTNVELYDGLKEITAFAEDLMNSVGEKFSLTNEQLSEIINSDSFENVMAEVVSGKEMTDANLETVEESESVEPGQIVEVTVNRDESSIAEDVEKVDAPTDEQVKAIVEETGAYTEEKANVKTEVEKQPEINAETVKSEEVRTAEPVKTQEDAGNNFTKGNEKKNSLFEKNNENSGIAVATQTTQTVNTVGEIVETVTSYTSYTDTENIMRQVTDFVKVNISGDVTEMEMQLHPASLGTVNMQINAQNGQITAHLTVQNELVKSILETQMIELQKTFDEQGTKVNAIEITVANYNLDSKNDNSFSQSENGSRKGNSRRNLNLNEIGSIEELTEDEQLEAKVMEMNGSSVNYTA